MFVLNFFTLVKKDLRINTTNKFKKFIFILAKFLKNFKKQKSRNYLLFFLNQPLFKIKMKI